MSDPLYGRGASRRRSRPRDSSPAKDAHGSSRPRTGSGGRSGSIASSSLPQQPLQVGWVYPSSSRCIACGQLGCTACGAKVDPAARRQKLEYVKLNTPYEKAKRSRTAEELLSEEARQRQRLMERFEAVVAERQLELWMTRHALALQHQEEVTRQQIEGTEAAQRCQWMIVADHHSVITALAVLETETRRAVMAMEQASRFPLQSKYATALQVLRLMQREHTTRETLCFNEKAQRSRVQTMLANRQNLSATHAMERQRFCEAVLESREEIVLERRGALEKYAALAASFVEHMQWHHRERDGLIAAVLQLKRELVSEEACQRHRIHEERLEEGNFLQERRIIYDRQLWSLVKTEATARSNIAEEAERTRSHLLVKKRSMEEEMREAEQTRADQREAEIAAATAAVRDIINDEAAAFTGLVQLELQHRQLRYEWIQAKELARIELLRHAEREKSCTVAAEELQAWQQLCQCFSRGVEEVLEIVAEKKLARERLCHAADAAVAELQKNEWLARGNIMEVMTEETGLLQRWCDGKAKKRLELCRGEEVARLQLVRSETSAITALLESHHELEEAIQQHVRRQLQELYYFHQEVDRSLAGIATEESQQWVLLCSVAAEEQQRVVEAYYFHCQMQLWRDEAQQRSHHYQCEIASRGSIQTKMAMSLRYVAEAVWARMQTQLAEVVAYEEEARALLYSSVDEAFYSLSQQQQSEELQIIIYLEACIAEELSSRRMCLTEDERLYDETESLIFPEEDDDSQWRRSPRLHSPTAASRTNQLLALRQSVVMQVLGEEGSSLSLSPSALDLLVAIVDHVNGRRAASLESLGAAERRASHAAKQLQQQERILTSEREKKEMYTAVLKREAEEREHRAQLESMEKNRSQHTMQAEKRRLADVTASLEATRKTLESLKASITKQYQR